MRKRTISVVLIALFVIQVLCVSAFAAPEDVKISVLLNEATRVVEVSASGFSANQMISVIGLYNATEVTDISKVDYLDQVTADAEGNVAFSYPSKAEWAAPGYVAVLLNGIIGSADIGGGIPAPTVKIVEFTNKITETYKANVKVVVAAENADAVTVSLFGNTVTAVDGVAWFMDIVAPAAGLYDLVAAAGSASDTAAYEVIAKPVDIWNAALSAPGDSFTVTFGAEVSCAKTNNGFNGYVKVGADTITSGTAINGNVVSVSAPLKAGDTVVISGVKFEQYFPSYSFTFTLTSAAAAA